jgi:hypothetical protein
MAPSNRFYVTLFSNASREIYDNNTHVDFTVKLSRPIYMGNSPNWQVGECELSFSSRPMESLKAVDVTPCADHAMIYCNIISPQFGGDSTVRYMRTYPNASCRHNGFPNVQYLPVQQRQFHSIRIEFFTLEELHVLFEDSTTPRNVMLQFQKYYQW